MEEMKPVMKNEKKYKLGIGKKIVAALLAIGLAIGLGVGLVACNKDPVDQDQNPGIEQPADPDDGKEDPDDGKEDPENPGGDIEEPTDPENPGGPTDPEEPENPDPSVPITPIEPGEIAPPQSIDMIFPDIDTNGELTETEKKILEISQGYQEKIEASLDEYLYETIALFTNSMTEDKISNIAWRLVADENDSSKVGKITISFDYNNTDTNRVFYVRSVVPQNDLTFAELYQGDSTILESAFESSRFGGAKYTTDFSFAHDPSIQGEYDSLAKALNDASGKSGESTYIVPLGYSDDDTLGEVMRFTVFNMEENGYNTATYNIKGTSASSLEDLIKSIQDGKFYSYNNESKAFTGNKIEILDQQVVVSTASETYRLYGKMKAKDGSSVNIYLPEDLMNELE